MSLPQLNRRLVLEAPVRESDGSGGYVTLWEPQGTLWAEVSARTGRETAIADAPVSSINYRIVIRAAPVGAPDRPRPEQRFRDGSRIFRILAVVEEDPSGRFLTCFASEDTAI